MTEIKFGDVQALTEAFVRVYRDGPGKKEANLKMEEILKPIDPGAASLMRAIMLCTVYAWQQAEQDERE